MLKINKIAKMLGYNFKRKEFMRDDEGEEKEEHIIWELNFKVPNYGIESDHIDIPKKEGRRRIPKDQFYNYDISDENKLGAVNHYNNVLDETKLYTILKEWGVFNLDKNPIEDIIVEGREERDIVNSFKVFARFQSCEGHVKMMNSILLEKNIREFISYYKYASKMGRHDPQHLDKATNKRIFKLLTNKISSATFIPDDIIKPREQSSEEEAEPQEVAPIKRNYEDLCQKLGRKSLRPSICYKASCSIPFLPGYQNLNEVERILVESTRIFPTRFLQIKKEILEFSAVIGAVFPPNSKEPYFRDFWSRQIQMLEQDRNNRILIPSPQSPLSKLNTNNNIGILMKIYYLVQR